MALDAIPLSPQCGGNALQTDVMYTDQASPPSWEELRTLASDLGDALRERRWVISTAESCTGGLIAGAITEIAGSSVWLHQSWVVYSNDAKQKRLNVPPHVMRGHGAVSQACVEAMCAGATAQSSSQLVVAVSGIAGPTGGSDDKPLGTVWLAWSTPAGVTSSREVFPGDRSEVRLRTVRRALAGCLDALV